jgi:phage protein D
MEAVTVARPRWIVEIAGKDITRDIAPFVIAISYTDALHGEAEDLSLTVENSDGRWLNDWMPAKGDGLKAWFGYEGGPLQPTAPFQVDELEYSIGPDTLAIKGVAAGVKPALRTRRSAGYDQTTLKAVVDDVAGRHGLTVRGEVEATPVARLTQNRERDLAFLKRVAQEHGYVCTVRGNDLVMAKVEDLKAQATGLTITRTMARQGGGTLKLTSAGHYRKARVTHHDPHTKTLIAGEAEDEGVDGEDVLRLNERAESPGHAKARARAALEHANRSKREGSLSLVGEPRLAAGVTIGLDGFGAFDGRYLVEKATHAIDRSGGYSTSIEFKDGGDAKGAKGTAQSGKKGA